MTMQTSKDVVAMFHFVCQKVPHDNTNLSTLFTLETVWMPVKAKGLQDGELLFDKFMCNLIFT